MKIGHATQQTSHITQSEFWAKIFFFFSCYITNIRRQPRKQSLELDDVLKEMIDEE